MVAKGQMAGAESVPRTPLVVEEMAAVVSMAGGVGGAGGLGRRWRGAGRSDRDPDC